jgi:hypothetical protein
MRVSGVELLNFLKKSLGIIIKRLEEGGVLAEPSFRDHGFVPEVEVTDAGVDLAVPGLVYKVKVTGEYPVYLNINRPVSEEEYKVVWPGSYYVVPRAGAKLYLKAPAGYKTKVAIEVLR